MIVKRPLEEVLKLVGGDGSLHELFDILLCAFTTKEALLLESEIKSYLIH